MTYGDDREDANRNTIPWPKIARILVIYEPDENTQLMLEGEPHIRWPESGRTIVQQREWFSRLVLSGKRAVILTNSDVFIHRARRIIAENPDKLEEIEVQWKSDIRMSLTAEGEREWPGEIFIDGLDEEIAIQRARFQNQPAPGTVLATGEGQKEEG